MARKQARKRWRFSWPTFFLGLATVAVLFAVNQTHPTALAIAELKATDLRMYSRPSQRPTGAVAIAAIDDKSIAALGHWPWPRSVMAGLERAFIDYKVAIVGYDILFSETDGTDRQRAEIAGELRAMGVSGAPIRAVLGKSNDQAFADAVRAQDRTFLAYGFASHMFGRQSLIGADTGGYLTALQNPPPMTYNLVRIASGAHPFMIEADAYRPPIPALLDAAAGTAYVDIDADADGVIRSELGVVKFHGRYCVPLFLAILRAAAGDANLALSLGKRGVSGISLGNINIPVNQVGQMLIRFRGPEGTFPHYSVSDIIDHKLPMADLAGKIVLVGVTGKGLGDRVVTPVEGNFPGVEVHANAIDNVLRGDFVRRSLDHSFQNVAAIVLGVLTAVTAAWFSALMAALSGVILGLGYFLYVQHQLLSHGILHGVVFPIGTLAVTYTTLATYRYVTEGLEKRRLRHAFEKYLHPDVIASVVDDPSGLKLGGERRHVSILFADIVSFTTRAERTEPEALVALLNTYMTSMTDVILKGGGVVDKLMGDGIMAFWGAPNELENAARASIDSAIEMLRRLAQLRAEDPRFADLDIGIGIAIGDAVVGNFGGEKRFDYSVIGDTVNFASRLEGLTRKFKVHLLVSRQTFLEARTPYIARDIGLVRVKGKAQLVPIVEVVGHPGDGIAPDFYRGFAKACDLLRTHDAEAARKQLLDLQAERPGDEVVNLYLEKLKEPGDEPPAEMVFELESK